MDRKEASSFYQHFDKKEKPTVDQLVGFFNQLIYTKRPLLTDFLNPREQFILKTIAGAQVNYQSFGGYENSEKKRVILDLNWDYHDLEEFQIVPIEIDYNHKFNEITHGQILGVLTSLGVKLSTFGDIITDGDGNWQFFVKKELSQYFIEQIDRVGRTAVKLKVASHAIKVEDDHKEVSFVSASLRLDAVLASVAHLSRSQAKTYVDEHLIKLNWHDAQDSNIMVSIDDVISVRHFGRMQIMNIIPTRKGKYRMEVNLWQSKTRNVNRR